MLILTSRLCVHQVEERSCFDAEVLCTELSILIAVVEEFLPGFNLVLKEHHLAWVSLQSCSHVSVKGVTLEISTVQVLELSEVVIETLRLFTLMHQFDLAW